MLEYGFDHAGLVCSLPFFHACGLMISSISYFPLPLLLSPKTNGCAMFPAFVGVHGVQLWLSWGFELGLAQFSPALASLLTV